MAKRVIRPLLTRDPYSTEEAVEDESAFTAGEEEEDPEAEKMMFEMKEDDFDAALPLPDPIEDQDPVECQVNDHIVQKRLPLSSSSSSISHAPSSLSSSSSLASSSRLSLSFSSVPLSRDRREESDAESGIELPPPASPLPLSSQQQDDVKHEGHSSLSDSESL